MSLDICRYCRGSNHKAKRPTMPFMSLTPPIQGTDLQRIHNGFTTDLLSGRQPLSFAFSLLPFDRFTMQSYNIPIAVHECLPKIINFFRGGSRMSNVMMSRMSLSISECGKSPIIIYKKILYIIMSGKTPLFLIGKLLMTLMTS